MSLETITVERTTDRGFTVTRTEDLQRVSETLWCVSWFALYHQLRKWRVDDDGIQNVEHQLTKKTVAVVQLGLE